VPNRILREGILTSPRIAKLAWAEEVFYRRLHSVVDDFGRYFADAGLLRAACYPRQLNKVSDPDIGKWLAACEAAALVRVYPAQDGERYLELLDFKQQVRAKDSKFPAPPIACAADATQTPSSPPASAHLGVSVSEVVSEDGGDTRVPRATPAAREKKTAMPEGFGISERVRAWAEEKRYGRLEEHLEAFKAKAQAKGYTYVNWDLAFMEAIREDWAKLRGRTANGAAPPPDIKAPAGPDPVLQQIKAHKGAPIPENIRAQIADALKGKTLQ
jgi:hypothetical protein